MLARVSSPFPLKTLFSLLLSKNQLGILSISLVPRFTIVIVILYEDRFEIINLPQIVLNRFAHALKSSVQREMWLKKEKKKRKAAFYGGKELNSETSSVLLKSLTGKLFDLISC